jgi:hypothetical protein
MSPEKKAPKMNRNETLVASRWIPKGSYAIRSKLSSAVVYLIDGVGADCSVRAKNPWAIGYVGNSKNHSFNNSFRSPAARAEYVRKWIIAQDEYAASKAGSKAAKAAKLSEPQTALAVGDVLCCSWGYDQTNVDFYQVVALAGKRSIDMQKIASIDVGHEAEGYSSMSTKVKPAVGKFLDDAPVLRKRVSEYGCVRMNSYSSASKCDPKDAHYCSWYA